MLYSRFMRVLSRYIIAIACVSFLSITLSGFHLHADVDGHDAPASHSGGLHHDLGHDLEHTADHVDISVFEPASGFSKTEKYAPSLSLPELTARPALSSHWSEDPPATTPRRLARLRLPARAPPISA